MGRLLAGLLIALGCCGLFSLPASADPPPQPASVPSSCQDLPPGTPAFLMGQERRAVENLWYSPGAAWIRDDHQRPTDQPHATDQTAVDPSAPSSAIAIFSQPDVVPDTRRPLLDWLRRWHERNDWQPIGQHPRMFADGTPIPDGNGPRSRRPTTFPQAFRQYLRCLRSRGQLLNEPKDAGKSQRNGNQNGNGNNKAGETNNSMNGNGGSQQPGAAVPEPARPPFDELGAERAGKAISIEGETGILGKGFEPTWYSAHAQGTVVDSVHDHFHAPYSGPLSLIRVEPHAVSETATFFFASRLWEGGDFVFNPEVAGGRGLSGSNGIAGFPNGEITRVGIVEPTPYFARLFMRQTIGFGGERELLEDGINQIAGTRDVNHLTIAVGRFAMTDVADDNRYSHDPRTQFLAWSIMYNGAWDYPANVRGYTDAIAIDYNQKNWALRYAIAAVPAVANGAAFDPHFVKANGQVLEWLGRYKVDEHPGNLRVMAYLNHAHMGDYREALDLSPVNPNVTLTRAYRFKYGFGVSWDQEITRDVGIFGRWGWNDGHTETWAFTPIDRTLVMGMWINGRSWCRPHDQFGMAFNMNGLAKDHRDYLAAGGLDFNIGDGKLNYGREKILEVLYNLGVTKNILFTLDFQEVWAPAYNRDRGPVTVFQGRFHIEF